MAMKNAKISPNMANSSFIRIIIYMAMKNANISQFGEFSHRRIVFKKTSPPPQKKKKERKKRGWVKRRRKEGCNEWETEPWCVWFNLWPVFCEICSMDGVRTAQRNFTHHPPFSLSLFLLARTRQDKLRSPHLTTNPLPLFLSGSRPSEEQGECGGNETHAVLSLYGKLMPICSQRPKTVLFGSSFRASPPTLSMWLCTGNLG